MSHTENTPLLEVRNLKKYFGKKDRVLHAVDDISVTIQQGKTLGVVGESGCGKSTLGRTVLRLLEPTDGQIIFDGQDITHVSEREMRKYRQSMQIIFQDPYSSLNPRKSVAEIIATPLKVNHICKDRASLQKRVRELMDTVGLAERLYDAYPHELDGGRRQRICIARALAINPKFIVCDEPVSALDVSIQAQILNLLMDLQDEMGLTYMFITHDLSVVKHISSEIMVMYLGRFVEEGPRERLLREPAHPYTRALLASVPSFEDLRDGKSPVRAPQQNIRGEIPIEGMTPDPTNLPTGCRFHPRCPQATERCREEAPQWKELEPGWRVRCHLYG